MRVLSIVLLSISVLPTTLTAMADFYEPSYISGLANISKNSNAYLDEVKGELAEFCDRKSLNETERNQCITYVSRTPKEIPKRSFTAAAYHARAMAAVCNNKALTPQNTQSLCFCVAEYSIGKHIIESFQYNNAKDNALKKIKADVQGGKKVNGSQCQTKLNSIRSALDKNQMPFFQQGNQQKDTPNADQAT